MPSLGSIFTGALQLLGLLDWAKQLLHDHSVRQVQQAADILVDKTATVAEVAEIQKVRDETSTYTHDQLVTQYASLRARIEASRSGSK